jgi:two-component system chemotaxis family response regulator WspR
MTLQAWEALSRATIVAIVIATAITASYIRRARRREEELERVVRERTHQLEDLNRKLEELSFVDGLTEVANRRQFEQLLNLEWRRAVRSRAPLTLIFADIDNFKKFNDTYGHQAGDRRLKEVATLLDGIVLRAGDQVARYGGEEFAALLPETDAAGAIAIAERMRKAAEALNNEDRTVTISLGVATTIATDKSSSDALVAAADQALYEAKRAGRNAVRAKLI